MARSSDDEALVSGRKRAAPRAVKQRLESLADAGVLDLPRARPGDVGDEVEDAVEAQTVLAKKLHAASDLLRLPVGQNVTMMISKTMIWTPMLS